MSCPTNTNPLNQLKEVHMKLIDEKLVLAKDNISLRTQLAESQQEIKEHKSHIGNLLTELVEKERELDEVKSALETAAIDIPQPYLVQIEVLTSQLEAIRKQTERLWAVAGVQKLEKEIYEGRHKDFVDGWAYGIGQASKAVKDEVARIFSPTTAEGESSNG